MSTTDTARPPADSARSWFSRRNLLWAYAGLVFTSIAFDYSFRLSGGGHIYVHDFAALLVGLLGVVLAVRNRTLIAGGRWFWLPVALFVFLLANTVLIGAFQYASLPADLHKLFWFEHLDAVRIVGELFACVWTFGQLLPNGTETWRILDVAAWGSAAAVAQLVAFSIATHTPHDNNTPFDVDILTGFPLAVVFVVRTWPRRYDLLRLGIFGAGASLLNSRGVMVIAAITTVAVLVASRDLRKVAIAIGSAAAGVLIVIVVPLLLSHSGSLSATTVQRLISIGDPQLAPYTIPGRTTIWRDALRISIISPVVGVGYHDYFIYSRVNEGNKNVSGLLTSRIKSGHNDYLSWLSETGVVGVGLLLVFWVSAVALAVRRWRSEPEERVRHSFTAALIVSIAVISVLDELLVPRGPEAVPPAMMWWIVLAALFVDAGRGQLNRIVK